jgi:hypothetical protein
LASGKDAEMIGSEQIFHEAGVTRLQLTVVHLLFIQDLVKMFFSLRFREVKNVLAIS